MRRGAIVVLGSFAVGCGLQSEHVAAPPGYKPAAAPGPYEPANDPLIGPAWVQATAAYVVEKCKHSRPTDDPTDGDQPHVEVVEAGGTDVQQACGLIANEVYTSTFVTRFAREICGLSSGVPDEPCQRRFNEMFIARLSERYASANWSAVAQRCTAYPFECNSPIAIERHLLVSHNSGVEAWYYGAVQYAQARQQAQYEEERAAQARVAAERAEDRRRFWGNMSNALGAMAQAMAPPPSVSCTSNQMGTTTITNCH